MAQNKRNLLFVIIGWLIFTIALSSCAVPTLTTTAFAGQDQGVKKIAASSQIGNQAADSGPANVEFTLKTNMADGRMVFIGVGGQIDGQINPELEVAPGQIVQITLVNDDGMQHNLAISDFNALTEDVFKQGDQAVIKFVADKEGRFPYFCTIPGHRQAGMEGSLVVGDAPEVEQAELADLSRPADDLPGPIQHSSPQNVRVDLETVEADGRLADGTGYTFWTFNGKVPGPFLRVRVGDTVEVHLKNPATSSMAHSVDFHAVTGPGGGAVFTTSNPGQETTFTFKVLNPGLFVYHCATPMVAEHITNGMFGLILVEPEGGLPPVDKEFYVMQSEVYTREPFGTQGELNFSEQKLLDERPEYYVFNGSVGALTALHPLKASVGETVRIFFGDGGPNAISSFHVIGEIFDRVYDQASLTSVPLTNVQTTLVPAGGATMVEFALQVPGRYILVDHALSRMQRGLMGYLIVDGPAAPDVIEGTPVSGSGH